MNSVTNVIIAVSVAALVYLIYIQINWSTDNYLKTGAPSRIEWVQTNGTEVEYITLGKIRISGGYQFIDSQTNERITIPECNELIITRLNSN